MRTILLLLVGLGATLPALAGAASQPPLPTLTAAQWQADVETFLRQLPQKHANAFHHLSRADYEAAAAALRARVASSNADEILVGMLQITARIGDGHTYVHMPGSTHRLPVELLPFGADLRVVRATEEARPLLGGRLVRIDDLPLAQVVERVHTIVSQDESDAFVRGVAPSWIRVTEVLHGLGVVADPLHVRLTVVDDAGVERTVAVTAIAPSSKPAWVEAAGAQPLYSPHPTEQLWFTWIETAKTVYVGFRGYDDLRQHSQQLWSFVDAHPASKIAFDLRDNGGGDYTKGRKYLVEPLRRRPLLHAYALVGNGTFSAAMNNSIDLRNAHATLVGETIGERPNSYQENDELTLPNSRVVVSYSTRFYEFLPKGSPPTVVPDQTIEPTWDEFRAGRDPVLEWVLGQP
ncbi:MAG TPA: hypothetical protein VGV61_18805, partial [Thermoanaerobaculia bacterium]|nr:hypothetical protein [Thermoanaerobaculia bacterium]